MTAKSLVDSYQVSKVRPSFIRWNVIEHLGLEDSVIEQGELASSVMLYRGVFRR